MESTQSSRQALTRGGQAGSQQRRHRLINEPYRSMQQLFEDMLQSTFGGVVGRQGGVGGLGTVGGYASGEQLPLDVTEDDRSYTISVELPGLTERDIQINLTGDNSLEIRGTKSQEQHQQTAHYLVATRSYGEFAERIPLPQHVDPNNITANLNRGVLTILVQKTQESQQRQKRIEVRSGSV